MLITFSIPPHPEGGAEFAEVVNDAATDAGVIPVYKWCRGREVRFTLLGATSDQHDQVIRALLTLDPLAKVRTARATYFGLDDFERQFEASLK